MAARLRKTHQDDVREKIKTSQLINRLQNHALGLTEMTPGQITAALGLLRKVLPELQSAEMTVTTSTYADDILKLQQADQGGVGLGIAPELHSDVTDKPVTH